MRFIDNENITDPRINLALEEYILRNLDPEEDFLLFYINGPSIIIGRNQNTLEEINSKYVQAHGVHAVRRLSGGGAVYHDLGNLNFSFITTYEKGNFRNFQKFTAPVTRVLQELGVPAELSGRNDILVNGRKISGNAQYRTAGRMFSHGTLLFDTNLEHMLAALNVKQGKITSKGLKSVRSRVANITEFLGDGWDIHAFRARLLQGIFEGADPIPAYTLTKSDWRNVRALSAERYANWDWNYGRSPDFNVQKSHRFAGGEVDVRIDVQQGQIAEVKIYGDFFGQGDVADIETQLLGARYAPESLATVLQDLDLPAYLGGVSREEFLQLLY
ncbi:MAG: lipoate--protein ligase [Chloroflexota bacterium]|nr:lipoate--protein ligase [Chloroflexota bacterium]